MESRKAAKQAERPFYAAPDNVPISSRIINEARSSLRTLRTQRPFTPSDEGRSLFGVTSVRNPECRPPSAFSLRSENFDRDSRPVSGTRPAHLGPLTPIEQKHKLDNDIANSKAPKTSSEPVRKTSIDGLAITGEPASRVAKLKPTPPPVSKDITQRGRTKTSNQDAGHQRSGSSDSRRVRSGPKERTREAVPYDDSDTRSNSASADSRRRSSPFTSSRESPAGASSKNSSEETVKNAVKSKCGETNATTPDADAIYYSTRVQPILDQISDCKGDAIRLRDLSERLYAALSDGNLLGRRSTRRSAVLKTVFRYLDSTDVQFLLCLSRIILALEVSGNNLLNVCKLLFKLCRSEENDEYFSKDPVLLGYMVSLMSLVDPTVGGEALVYLIGTVKLLSGSGKVVEHLARLLIIQSTAELLANIVAMTLEKNQKDQIGHILVQLTATIRNLADSGGSRQKILQNKVIELLCTVLHQHQHDADIVLNVSRILSKLTLHTDCCDRLAGEPESFATFLLLLHRHVRKEDIVVRMSFILGNLTAKSERARQAFYQQNKSLDTLMQVFRVYIELDLKLGDESRSETRENDSKAGKIEDVLVKIVRVIANLSISEEIGPVLSSYPAYSQLLLHILERKTIEKSEELVLNTVTTINNLTYYLCQDTSSDVQELLLEIAEALLNLFHVDHMDGLSEAARVYGNLSRHKALRDFMHERQVDRMLVALLDSGSRELVYTACGVLINLMVDEDKRSVLRTENGVQKLVDVLRDLGRNDWQLATMVCQILWNYSSRMKSSSYIFGDVEAQLLTDLLVEYTDEESALTDGILASMDEDTQDYVRDIWDTEFCPVAQQLLNRMDKYQSKFEPLDAPSGESR